MLPASVWNGPHMSVSMWNHLKVVKVPQYPDVYGQTERQVWAKVESGVTVCHCTFDLWHCRYAHAHFLMLEFMLGHTNRAVTEYCVAHIPGCNSEWSKSNAMCLKLGGMQGWGTSVETSVMACLWLWGTKEMILVKQVLYHSPVPLPSLWSRWWCSVLHVILPFISSDPTSHATFLSVLFILLPFQFFVVAEDGPRTETFYKKACYILQQYAQYKPISITEDVVMELYSITCNTFTYKRDNASAGPFCQSTLRWIVKWNPDVGFALEYTYLSSLRECRWGACDWYRSKIADLQWNVKNVWLTSRWLGVSYQTCCIGFVQARVVWRSRRLDTTNLQYTAAILSYSCVWGVTHDDGCRSIWLWIGKHCGASKCFLSSHESRCCFARPLQLNASSLGST